MPASTPLTYKTNVIGRRIDNEPQFGLPGDDFDNVLSRQTQVVELNGIVDGINDSRTLRALLVSVPGKDHWVVEADVGVFTERPQQPQDRALCTLNNWITALVASTSY